MKLRRGIFVVLALAVGCVESYAQQSREIFGKNRMQYRQFEWQYLTVKILTRNYDAQKESAEQALEYIESEFD